MTSSAGPLRWWAGFGPRIIALVGLVALLSSGSVGTVALQRSRMAVRTQALTSDLAAARAVAAFTGKLMTETEASVIRFAARPAVAEAIRRADIGELSKQLAQLEGDSELLDGVGLTDEHGVLIASSMRNNLRIGSSLADRDYYQQASSSDLPFLAQPAISASSGRPVTSYAVPVDVDGRVQGVVVGAMSLSVLSDLIAGIHTSPQARTVLVDRRGGPTGTIIADPDQTRLLAVLPDNEAARLVVMSENGTAEVRDSSGVPELVAFAQVQGVPWGILIQQPKEEAFAALMALDRSLALIAALLALIAAGVGIGLAGWLTRPLAQLERSVSAYAAGERGKRAGLSRKDEIGRLGRAFDCLADELNARDAKLQALLDDLERQVADRTHELTVSNSALARQKATLDAVMGSMSDGLLVLNDSGSIHYWNRRALELLGLEMIDIKGSSLAELFERIDGLLLDAEAAQAAWQRALDDPAEAGLFEISLGEPLKRDLQLQAFSVAPTANTLEWRGVLIRDVTASRELLRAKNELVATVSHELRTPLASLVGFTELLLDEHEPSYDDRRLYLSTMRDDGQRLTELIDNFLDLQRMEAGPVSLQLGPVDLGATLRRLLAGLGDARHRIVLDVAPDLPEVLADDGALRGIAGNLLSNACKYSPEGSEICLAARPVGDEVHVSVTDHGEGLRADMLPNLFQKFYRADNSDRRTSQGAGLGLAITRQLAEAMGGRIWAESAGAGQGSRFVFTLRPAKALAASANGHHGGK